MELIFENIANELLNHSISISDNIFSESLISALKLEAELNYEKGEFKAAKIGKGLEKQRISEVRGDEVKWLEKSEATDCQLEYWDFVDGLRNYLSGFFRIHLERTELHLAYYPQGAFYTKHLDQFREHSNRVFSIILYLNTDWKNDDGGQLRIHNQDQSYYDIQPIGNRLVVFRSDAIEHEVLVSAAPRISLTGWIRRDNLIY